MSVHVQSPEAAPVVDAIRTLMLESGLVPGKGVQRDRPTEADAGEDEDHANHQAPGDDDPESDDSHADDVYDTEKEPRSIDVFGPVKGWVGVLDTQIGGIEQLGRALSTSLRTKAIAIYVNDSDSWGYELYENGVSISSFDSAGTDDSDADELMSPELQAAMDRGDKEEAARLTAALIEKQLNEAPTLAGLLMPSPQLVALSDRVRNGRATW